MKAIITTIAAAAALAACTTTDNTTEGAATTPEGPCDAAAGQSLVGQPYSEALHAEALRLTGAETVRAYRTGDPVTMDYRPDRVNIEHEGGTVRAIACG